MYAALRPVALGLTQQFTCAQFTACLTAVTNGSADRPPVFTSAAVYDVLVELCSRQPAIVKGRDPNCPLCAR